jgi:hypothetical protein
MVHMTSLNIEMIEWINTKAQILLLQNGHHSSPVTTMTTKAIPKPKIST